MFSPALFCVPAASDTSHPMIASERVILRRVTSRVFNWSIHEGEVVQVCSTLTIS